jgi:hypothetical protein
MQLYSYLIQREPQVKGNFPGGSRQLESLQCHGFLPSVAFGLRVELGTLLEVRVLRGCKPLYTRVLNECRRHEL